MQNRSRIYLLLATAFATVVFGPIAESAQALDRSGDAEAVEELAASWVAAVHARDASSVDLLSRAGRRYYPKLARIALQADVQELDRLPMVDQLQAMLLRLMLEPEELEAMNEAELLLFAVRHGLIGMSLRSNDRLGDVVVGPDRARGRLYKFGLEERPDRGLQYFVREKGHWRIELRGELERMRADFDAFVARSRLPEAEAAFFILEARLMRKISPDDFAPPQATTKNAPAANRAPERKTLRPALRLVAIRAPVDSNLPIAATIEDRAESLRYVLEPGDVLPPHPSYRLLRLRPKAAVLATSEGEIVLPLDPAGPTLSERLRPLVQDAARAHRSLLDFAAQGEGRKGLMAQWRNVGLRDRPLLLQQASLVPVYGEHRETDVRSMRGLRVQKLTEGSFWHQLGMRQGDLLTEVNGRPIDSMNAWKEVLVVAQNDLDITIRVERAKAHLAFRTRTIQPR